MIATCYALTFQSVSLEDGLAEFMTFIRGIMIVGIQMMFRGIKPIFENMMEQDADHVLMPHMESLPLIQKSWVDPALEAITNLKALCLEPIEVEYQGLLINIVEKLYINSWDGQFNISLPLLQPSTEHNSSIQSIYEAIRLVDGSTTPKLPGGHQPEQPSHGPPALALGRAQRGHVLYPPAGEPGAGEEAQARRGMRDRSGLPEVAQVAQCACGLSAPNLQPVADVGGGAAEWGRVVFWKVCSMMMRDGCERIGWIVILES